MSIPSSERKTNEDDLAEALRAILPLAEDYLRSAPNHPDNAKLEDARAALVDYDASKYMVPS